MLRMALSALVAFMFALTMTGCGGQLDGSYDENSILGNGEGSGVAQGDAVGDGEASGEAQDGENLAECEAGYVPCACGEQVQDPAAEAVQTQDETAVSEQVATEAEEAAMTQETALQDGELVMLKSKVLEQAESQLVVKTETATMTQDETQEEVLENAACCCLVE